MLLKGKNALITGARRGIGRTTVEMFAEEGCSRIWACARTQDSCFENDMRVIGDKYGVEIVPIYFDMSDETAVKDGVKTILKDRMPIDVLVNNAGVAYSGLMTMTPIGKLREVFEVNFFAQILMMQLVARVMMRQRSGTIINIASIGGIEANPGYLAYGSSKASLIWATRCAAKELASCGIRVNAVAPGLTKTDMGGFKPTDELSATIERTALKRIANASEVANAITFLASDRASFITGHIMRVDGGRI